MTHHARQYRLHILGQHMIAILHQRPRAGCVKHSERGPGRQAMDKFRRLPGMTHQRLHVIEQRTRRVHLLRRALQLDQRSGFHARLELRQEVTAVLALQERTFRIGIGIAELDAHEKAIQLRFRQRKGADQV